MGDGLFFPRLHVILCHKAGLENKVADALNPRVFVLTKMSMVVNDFEKLRTEYEPCSNFVDIYAILKDGATREVDGYTLQDGHLFLGRKLCIQEPHLENFLSENCMSVV